jgi:RNA polymerase sigma-70 factor (ECF subfamily)
MDDGPEPLIRRAQGGDERAFQELFVRHRGDVTRLVHRILGGSADAEDVVQDVFVHVFRSLPSFRGESKFSTWLYRLTVNVARMHLRRGRSRPRFADVPVPEGPRDGRPAETPDVVHERSERVRALRALLDGLSEKKRTVLVLHDLEGMPAKEIADVVGAPVLTVRTRLFYARKELYAALAGEPSLAPIMDVLMAALPGKPADKRPESGPAPRPDASVTAIDRGKRARRSTPGAAAAAIALATEGDDE